MRYSCVLKNRVTGIEAAETVELDPDEIIAVNTLRAFRSADDVELMAMSYATQHAKLLVGADQELGEIQLSGDMQ